LPVATAAERTITDEALRAAEAYAAEFDSFALIVVHGGRVQTEWYREDRSPADLTQSQSMMKTVTALMVGAAIEDGLIRSLDDPIGDYLEEWRDDPRGRITLRNLLNMSSGLGKYEFSLNPFGASSAFRFLFSHDRDPIVLDTPLEWQPGSRFDYNDVAAQLAGMVVQRVIR
jgi:CubicO group peptidase (beta-lactamase class C family)